MTTKNILNSFSLMRSNKLNYAIRAVLVLLFFTLGTGNAWAGHDQHTATLKAEVGTGSGTVYASTSSTATTGSASASFNCGKSSDGQHTGDLYAFATPAAGYTFLGWTTSKTSTEGADKANPKSVAFNVTDASNTQTLYAHFVEKAKVNITFEAPSNGTYTIAVNGGSAETVLSSDVVKNNVTDVTLTATPASGYAFAGWYKLNSAGEFVEDLSISSPYDASFTKSETIKMGARFVPTTLGKFILKGSSTEYYGLKAATVAAGGSGIIVPVAEETLVDGSDLMPFDNGTYSIKAGATLLIPYSSANEVQTKPKDIAYNTSGWTTALSIYKKLITREGVSINVMSGGVLCVGGQLVSYNGGNPSAYPIGACGVLDMSNGGHIELNGTIYCWGFIKGQDMDQGNNTVGVGTIAANSGSVIWEDFAVGDWRGGTACSTIAGNASSWKFFPFQSYTIQNVEVPTTYHYGATLSNYTNVYGGGGKNEGTFSLIGKSNTLFQLKDASSSVCKWYDPTTDLVNYEMRGTAQLDALNVDAGITTVSSSSYNLPLSSNMQIVLAAGCNMTLSKPMVVQPGAVVEVKSGASLTLSSNTYIFDVDNWGMYCNGRYFYSMTILTSHKNRGTGKSKDLLDDAKLIVDGTLNVTGKIYATDGGANIMGNGAGSISLSSLGSNGNIVMCTGVSTNENVAIAQANLCNEDESYTKSIASTTFHNVNGRWFAASAKDEKANHTYDFTYISSGAVSGTGGTSSTTDALYAPDKTGLAAGMKWCNVAQDGPCSNIFNATQALNETPASDIRYTYPSSSWLQLLKTETEGVYGGSDNSLYAVDGCAVNSLGSVDENCLYTINDVKKALVDGHFVALEKNTEDEAWHDVANPTNYYICFEGCNWHPATKYDGEEKAYIVEEGDYIWYNNNWLLVEREDPFFFDYNEQNVKRYYEYVDGAWVLASPRVRVVDAIETREFYKLPEAISVASGKKNTTITILKDISGINSRMTYSASNTTCTLDLNGHTVSGAAPFGDDNNRGLLIINASGTTFTITDNSANKEGRLENICNQNKVTYTVHLMAGTLNVEHGTIHAENPAQYASKAATVDNVAVTALTACGARAVQVAAAQKLNISGGRLEAYATRNAYGIVATGNTANTTQVTITGGKVYAEAPCGAYGISCTGKLNMSAGLVEAKLNDRLVDASYAADNASNNLNKHQTCYTIIMGGSANATASSCFYGTLTVTGGTIKASSDLERSYTANVFAIYMNISVAGKGNRNYASTSGTNAEQACAVGSVKNATIDVFTKGNYGYGIYVLGKYNSKDKTNTVFKVENTNVTVKAYNYAYGIYSCGGINGTTGECYTGDVELTNNTVYAEAYKAAGAYATWVWAGYATIYQDKQANYYGEYAAGAKMTINSGAYTAKTKTTSAYATGTSLRAKSIYAPTSSTTWGPGEGKEALATLIINGGTFNATAGSYTARGVSSGGNTTIKDATFNVVATTYYAYGLYAQSGKLTATNVIVNDTAKGRVSSSDNNAYAYGAMADISTITSGNQAWTGYSCAGEIELNNCTINAVASAYANARGVMVNAGSAMMTRANFENQKTSSGWSAATYNAYNSVFPVQVQGKDSVWVGVAGKITVNGGTYTVKTKTTTAYGAFVNRALKYSYTKPNTILEEFQGTLDINNATFDVKTEGTTTAEGIRSYGQTTITDGSFTVKPKTATAYGIKLYAGKTTVNGNPEFNVTATTTAYGILVGGGEQPSSTTGATYNGEVEVNGGTFNVETTTDKPAYGVYVYGNSRSITSTAAGYYAGNYASAGKATINDGVFNVKSKKTEAYGIAVNAVVNQSGASGYDAATANPKCFVNGGKFKVEGTSSLYMVNSSATAENFQISGGYYSHNTNLNKYKVSPKKVLTLRSTHSLYPDYKYTINEGGTVTWKNGTTTLKTEMYESGETPEYTGETPTKADDAEYAYTHNGWNPTIAAMANADKTYTATFNKAEKKYAVSIAAGANGSVSPASVSNIGCETASGDITATPNVGYSFSGWTLPEGVTAADGYTVTSNPIRIHATAAGKTITASFVPRTDINYTVKHWQQNIENDEYTEVTADQETKQGTTATLTAATAKTYTGFTALPITQETIAGDGTTVVNIYYNRKTYTIAWVDGNNVVIETDENVAYGTIPSFDGTTPTKAQDNSYTYTFTGWDPMLEAVTGNATYTAQFEQTARPYTITWLNYDGSLLNNTTSYWNETPAYPTYGTPTYTDNEHHVYRFIGWSPKIHKVNSDENVYTAQYERIDDLVITTEEPIEENTTLTTTTVRVKGKLNVPQNVTLTTDDLILEGTPSSSGEITGEGTVAATRALFDFSQPGGFKAKTWYAVAVPWQVAVPAYEKTNNGVYIKKGSGEFVQQELGRSFDLIYYDGARRATGASKAWNYVEDDENAQHIMYPGRAYMIYLTADADIIRFERKEGAELHTTQVETKKYPAVNESYADWNGVANPATYHAYLNVGATEDYGQVYNADTKQYELFNMSENKLVVGQPIFVQPAEETTIVANANTYNPSLAPHRAQAPDNSLTRYEMMLAKMDEDVADRIIVRMDEEKEENTYVVGQDLVKMGVSDIVPQMWIDRYASKMCINTIAPVNNIANYPLSISVQRDGEYELFIADQPNDETMLYLTYDGAAICNLSYGGYVANLTKGTNTHYGLRIVVKSPEIATGIDEAVVDAKGETRKMLINDQVFIIRGEKVYSIDGKLVK